MVKYLLPVKLWLRFSSSIRLISLSKSGHLAEALKHVISKS